MRLEGFGSIKSLRTTVLRRLDSKTAVHKPSKNVSCLGRIQNLFQGRAPNFVTFSSVVFFPVELILSNLSYKKDCKGDRGHAPPNIFENLHTAMAILTLFVKFSDKVCS